MGIEIEFNPDLALRKFNSAGRRQEECLPYKLEKNEVYPFLKEGYRYFTLGKPTALRLRIEKNNHSNKIADIIIMETRQHIREDNNVWTEGKYFVKEVLNRGE